MQKWEYLSIVVNMDERAVTDIPVNDVKVFDRSLQPKSKEVEISDLFEPPGFQRLEPVSGWGTGKA